MYNFLCDEQETAREIDCRPLMVMTTLYKLQMTVERFLTLVALISFDL